MAENFDLIFGQNASQQYAWSDNDYQKGWETIGNIPPTAAQFDALQRRSDTKLKELNDELTPLVNADTADSRQPSTTYSEGDIKYSSLLPTGWFLTCTTAGTTSASELVLPTPIAEGDTVTDGTVVWTIRKLTTVEIHNASSTVAGIMKLYSSKGTNTDGAMTQQAITNELAGKANRALDNLSADGENHFLKNDFTIIYPNGGTGASPANVAAASRYVESNPFAGYYVYCVAEVKYNNRWCETGYAFGTASSWGVNATHLMPDDNIIVQVGNTGIVMTSTNSGNGFNITKEINTPLPCRVKVWKIGKIPT